VTKDEVHVASLTLDDFKEIFKDAIANTEFKVSVLNSIF